MIYRKRFYLYANIIIHLEVTILIFEGFQNGINLGGWISQFDKYDKAHFDSFITEKDIAYIASLGYDHVRVPVDYNVLEDEDGNIIPSGFGYLENCRSWCEKHHLNMLIDLHECYGYSFDPLKKDMDRKKFFYDDALQERFLHLWSEIAVRFKDYPDQVAFEPLNEVVLEEVADAWNDVIAKYVTLMRSIVPEAYLVIGGVCYNNVLSVPLIKVPDTYKIVFNFHCYEPMVFTHQGAYWVEDMPLDFRIGYPKSLAEYRKTSTELSKALAGAVFKEGISDIGPAFFADIFAPAVEAAKKAGVPLYCGEYGVIELASQEDKDRWLADISKAFDTFGVGRALWNYKEKDFGIVTKDFPNA